MRSLVAAILAFLPLTAWGGGTAFACRYESLTDNGKGHFTLTLHAIEEPDLKVTFEGNRQLVLHLQYSDRDPLPSGNRPVSHAEFSAALSRIRSDLAAHATTRLGILGSAFREIKGQPGHYRVYGLRLEDEGDPLKTGAPLVVYAY